MGWIKTFIQVLGVLVVTTSTAQDVPDFVNPDLNQSETQTSSMGAIGWIKDYAAGMAQAEELKKPVFIDFHATWCGPCRMMDEITFQDRSVIHSFSDFVPIKIDTDQDRATAFKYQVTGIPRYIVLNIFGETIGDQVGFLDADQLNEFLAKTKAIANKLSDGTIIRVSGPPAPPPNVEVTIPEDATAEVLLEHLSNADPKTRTKARKRFLEKRSDDLRQALFHSLSDDYLGTRIAAWETIGEWEEGIEASYDPWDLRENRLLQAQTVRNQFDIAEPKDHTNQMEVNP